MNSILEDQNMIRPIETIINSPKINRNPPGNKHRRYTNKKHRNKKTKRTNKHKSYRKFK